MIKGIAWILIIKKVIYLYFKYNNMLKNILSSGLIITIPNFRWCNKYNLSFCNII